MKNILFCLLVLLACFRPNNLHATGTQQICKFDNAQQESYSCNEGFLKSDADLLELFEDDTTDPEDEGFGIASDEESAGFTTSHLYNFYLYPIYYNRNSFARPIPVFILHRVFRL